MQYVVFCKGRKLNNKNYVTRAYNSHVETIKYLINQDLFV